MAKRKAPFLQFHVSGRDQGDCYQRLPAIKLNFLDHVSVKITGLDDLTDLAALIAHVGQFVFAGPNPMVGMPMLTGVTALVLKSQ